MTQTRAETPEERSERWAREAAEGAAESARTAPVRAVGRWMALGALGVLCLAVVGGLVWFFRPVHGPRAMAIDEIGVGTCFPGDPGDELDRTGQAEALTTVECDKPHRAEVFSSWNPGHTLSGRAIASECDRAFAAWAKAPVTSSSLQVSGYTIGTEAELDDNKGIALCVAVAPQPVSGSLLGR